ncbi:XRE family transcriptional regulator [Leucobacter sp. gxy201]|uniref:XRE family transcriptional regulator n=1 Tax=Leucobacter sp. gxy201 TaxID=2957200 RepID=UPI003DA0D23F
MDDEVRLTSDLARAARAFTKVSKQMIADEAGLARAKVRDFERGVIDLDDREKAELRRALEVYGALFIPEDDTAGYGVRRRHPREKLMRLNTWEGEGGSA